MNKLRWDEMTRDELLQEKSLWEARLQDTKRKLSEARQRAYLEKVYLPAAEYRALEARHASLVAGLRGITTVMAANKLKAFSDYFLEAADELLSDVEYDKVCDLAEQRMTTDRAVKSRARMRETQ